MEKEKNISLYSSTFHAINFSFFFFFINKKSNDYGRKEAIKKKDNFAERTRLMTVPSSVPTTAALIFRSVTVKPALNLAAIIVVEAWKKKMGISSFRN